MSEKFKLTILVAPLDWGLGHATRCIPIIRYLKDINCNVIIASEGSTLKLLKEEFPSLQFVNLQGYRVSYAKSKRFFSVKILLQLPKIFTAIKSEHNWLEKIESEHDINAIIADNRYGLYSKKPSIIITHQLTIKAPFKWMESIMQTFHYRMINKFRHCWVPDNIGETNFAGELSHPVKMPAIDTAYIGGLSRLNKQEVKNYKYKILVVISGPEPFRTLLEQKILQQIKEVSYPVLFVRGLPASTQQLPAMHNVVIQNHLSAKTLENAFNESEFILSRCGYTTVMDIIKLGKKSILIPTPGQTEQEYLAKHLQQQGWCFSVNQSDFNLSKAMKQANDFDYKLPVVDMEIYKHAIDALVASLKKTN